MGLYSALGTCFKAAACRTISTSLKANLSLSLSLICPKKNLNFLFFFRLRVHSCENQLKDDLQENYSSLNKSFGKKNRVFKNINILSIEAG